MNGPQWLDHAQLLTFVLDGQRYALRLNVVERVIRAAAVTAVPEAPAFVLGLVNLAGQLLPVLSLRRCLGLPDRRIRAEDQFVIVRTARSSLVLTVDAVQGVCMVNTAQTVPLEDVLRDGARRVQGQVMVNGEVVLLYDLEDLFSPADEDRILQATSAEA
jgi:purine-binding chemotaxis protein CheW